jgi:DHA2 family multidrug resistance protein
MGNATSIFNLMRNIGGSVGIAIMTTFLARRTQRHQNHLVADVTPGNLQALRLLQGLRANFHLHGADSVTASRKALAALYGMVQQHASMLAFVEAFWVMGVVFLLMIPFVPFIQYTRKRPVPKPTEKLHKVDAKAIRRLASENEGMPEEHHLLVH